MGSALYIMRYVGREGMGGGAMYVGHGIISGVDVGEGRYDGSYTEEGGRLHLQAKMVFPAGGALVTGQQVPPGYSVQLEADWPSNFADGQPQAISVAGQPVHVSFQKLRDLP